MALSFSYPNYELYIKFLSQLFWFINQKSVNMYTNANLGKWINDMSYQKDKTNELKMSKMNDIKYIPRVVVILQTNPLFYFRLHLCKIR